MHSTKHGRRDFKRVVIVTRNRMRSANDKQAYLPSRSRELMQSLNKRMSADRSWSFQPLLANTMFSRLFSLPARQLLPLHLPSERLNYCNAILSQPTVLPPVHEIAA